MSAKKIADLAKNSVFILLATVLCMPAAQNVRAQNAPTASAPITDDGFVRDAFLASQTQIEISRIALEKSHNTSTKKLAKTIIKDYTTANTQLRNLAATKSLEVPVALDGNHKAQVEQFNAVADAQLDASYRAQIQRHHDAAIVLYDRVAKNPRSDAELRVFASKMLPVLQKYQQAIAKSTGAPVSLANRK